MTADNIIDAQGNIHIADTDSYTLELVLEREDGSPFTSADKVLVVIMDSAFSKKYVEKILNIENSVAFFRMSVEDAKKIPAGKNTWSYSVLLNARKMTGGGYTADEKITPFMGYRQYYVEEDPSNARD
jgi:hypothetical protein